MSRDYRYGHNQHKTGFQRQSQKQADQRERSAGRGRVWLISALLSLCLVGGFLIVQHFTGVQAKKESQPPSKIYSEVNEAAPALPEEKGGITVEAVSSSPEKAGSNSGEAPKPLGYSFYEGLKETEVVVDAVPISVQLEHAYYIHAGTFGKQKYALQEQQRLKRLGQAVSLSVIEQSGRTYYRLRTGPFQDRLEMNRVRNELRSLGVDTLLVQAPRS